MASTMRATVLLTAVLLVTSCADLRGIDSEAYDMGVESVEMLKISRDAPSDQAAAKSMNRWCYQMADELGPKMGWDDNSTVDFKSGCKTEARKELGIEK